MILAETGADPKPSAWARSRNMQRTYDRELTALKSPGGKGSKAKAAAVARAKDEEHVRQRALARTRRTQEHAEEAHRHSAAAESLLGHVDDVPGALESLAQARRRTKHLGMSSRSIGGAEFVGETPKFVNLCRAPWCN